MNKFMCFKNNVQNTLTFMKLYVYLHYDEHRSTKWIGI